MRLKDAEWAKLAALIHYGLNNWNFVQLLARKVVYSLDEFVLGNIWKTVFTVFSKPAIFSKNACVDQTLENAIGEAGIAHIVETR